MTKIRWTGPNLNKIAAQLEVQANTKKIQAVLALMDSVDEGTLALQDFLEKAYTNTGIHREMFRGGQPGRHDTGNMVGSISNNTHAPEYDGDRTVAAFGWFAGQFEQYFMEQDLGFGKIPAANAMRDAAQLCVDRMRARMLLWEKGNLSIE